MQKNERCHHSAFILLPLFNPVYAGLVIITAREIAKLDEFIRAGFNPVCAGVGK